MKYFLTLPIYRVTKNYPLVSCVYIDKNRLKEKKNKRSLTIKQDKDYIRQVGLLDTFIPCTYTTHVTSIVNNNTNRQTNRQTNPVYFEEKISQLARYVNNYWQSPQNTCMYVEAILKDYIPCTCKHYMKWPIDILLCRCEVHHYRRLRSIIKVLNSISIILTYKFIVMYAGISVGNERFQKEMENVLLPEKVFGYYLRHLDLNNMLYNLMNQKFSIEFLEKHYYDTCTRTDTGYCKSQYTLPFHLLVKYQTLSCELMDCYIQKKRILLPECWGDIKKYQPLSDWFVKKYDKYLSQV